MRYIVNRIRYFIKHLFHVSQTDEDYEFEKWFYDQLKEDN